MITRQTRRANLAARLGELKIKQTHFRSVSPKMVAEAFKAGKQAWLFDCTKQCDQSHVVKQIYIGTQKEVQQKILGTVGAVLMFKGQWQRGWTLTELKEKDLAAFLPGAKKKASYQFLDALNEVIGEIAQSMHDYMEQNPPEDLYSSEADLARLENKLALEMSAGYIGGMHIHDQTMLAIELRTLGGGISALAREVASRVLDRYQREFVVPNQIISAVRRRSAARNYVLVVQLANDEDPDELGRHGKVPLAWEKLVNRLNELYTERLGRGHWDLDADGLTLTVTNLSDAISAERLFLRACRDLGFSWEKGVDYKFVWTPSRPRPWSSRNTPHKAPFRLSNSTRRTAAVSDYWITLDVWLRDEDMNDPNWAKKDIAAEKAALKAIHKKLTAAGHDVYIATSDQSYGDPSARVYVDSQEAQSEAKSLIEDTLDRLGLAYEIRVSRPPTAKELKARKFLEELRAQYPKVAKLLQKESFGAKRFAEYKPSEWPTLVETLVVYYNLAALGPDVELSRVKRFLPQVRRELRGRSILRTYQTSPTVLEAALDKLGWLGKKSDKLRSDPYF